MIKVYIASPYTIGDVGVNVRKQLEVTDTLIDRGFAPYTPLYSHFQHIFNPKGYDVWLKLDLEWIKQCDCLLRIPGVSAGADIEVAYAEENGIPVFNSLEEVYIAYDKKEEKC